MAPISKAVILCGGKGKRLAPLTDNIPKVLVKVEGKSLLDYKLEILEGLVDEIIIVIGYKGDKIKDKIGNKYKNLKITYVIQKEPLGTGHALECAKEHLKDRFLVMNGDDIYSKDDIKKLIEYERAILAKKVEEPSSYGVMITDENNYLKKIIEKPQNFVSDLANTGCYVFDSSIFKNSLESSERGELEIMDFFKNEKDIKVVEANGVWIAINDHYQLENARKVIREMEV